MASPDLDDCQQAGFSAVLLPLVSIYVPFKQRPMIHHRLWQQSRPIFKDLLRTRLPAELLKMISICLPLFFLFSHLISGCTDAPGTD